MAHLFEVVFPTDLGRGGFGFVFLFGGFQAFFVNFEGLLIFSVVFDGFFGAKDLVGGGGFVTLEAAQGALFRFSPIEGIGGFGVEFGFDVEVGAGSALEEPIGVDEFGDQMALGVVFGIVGFVPDAIEVAEFFFGFTGE